MLTCGACRWFVPSFGYRPGYEFMGHRRGKCLKLVRFGVYEDEAACPEFELL